MIKIKNLCYKINDIEILKNINIEIHDGEIIGIIGKSGSGKTALLNILAGQVKEYTGEALYDTIPILSFSKKDLVKKVSYLPSNPHSEIIDDTVFNFLIESRKFFKKIFNPFSDYDIQITEDYINYFELSSYKEQKILTLPDGIFKKSLLAFAFTQKADTIILDNPTSNIDLHSILLLQKTMYRYVIDGDRISIVASNDLNFISQTVDRILMLENGVIVADGNPDILDAQVIQKYFHTDVLISKNIYNGRPNIHQYPAGEG